VDKSSPDLLIYVLIIGGMLLFSILTQRAARRRQEEEKSASAVPPVAEEPLPDIWGRTQARPAADPQPFLPAPAHASAAPPIAAEGPRPRAAAISLLKGGHNLRQAIVVMTVMGPCRALEPPRDVAGGSTSRRSDQ
jgi:hypothetical protein